MVSIVHGVALANPVGHEDDLGGEPVGLGREDPHALHHRAALWDRRHVLEAVVRREFALEFGLNRQQPALQYSRSAGRQARLQHSSGS